MNNCDNGDCGPIAVLAVVVSDSCIHCPKTINVTIPIIRDTLGQFLDILIVDIKNTNTLGDNGPKYRAGATPGIFLISKQNHRPDYILVDDDCYNLSLNNGGVFMGNSSKSAKQPELLSWVDAKLRSYSVATIDVHRKPKTVKTKKSYVFYKPSKVSLI